MQTFVTRRFDALDPVVATVTWLSAGTGATNVVPDTARLAGTVRVLSHVSTRRVLDELPALVHAVAAAHGCTAEVIVDLVCAPTVNDAAAAAVVAATVAQTLGPDRFRDTAQPVMGAEDFGTVLAEVPGALFFLRATPAGDDPDAAAPLHSPHLVLDDAVLADQAVLLASLALHHVGGREH